MKNLIPAVGVMCLLFVSFATAQTKREVLTNPKIIELVRLGLSAEIIAEKIRQSDCLCDTGTAALTKLKAAKVPDAVIMAMLNAESGGYSDSAQPRKAERAEDNSNSLLNQPKTPVGTAQISTENILDEMREPGIYLLADGKTTALEPAVFSGTKTNVFSAAMTYGIKKAKIRAVVRGKSSNLQTKSARPEFYFVFSREYGNSGALMAGSIGGYAATSPAEFMLVSMKVKENSREAILGEVSVFSASTGTPDKYIREYSFEKIKPGVYKVIPKVGLTSGEYCFYYSGASGAGGKIFDFSVIQ